MLYQLSYARAWPSRAPAGTRARRPGRKDSGRPGKCNQSPAVTEPPKPGKGTRCTSRCSLRRLSMPPQADPGERRTSVAHARGPGVGAPSRPDAPLASTPIPSGPRPFGKSWPRARTGHTPLVLAAACALAGIAALAAGGELFDPLRAVVGLVGGLTAAGLLVVYHRRRAASVRRRADGGAAGPFGEDAAGRDTDERVRELEHRLANLLGTVSALLDQSRRTRDDPAEAMAHFERRLGDLRRLHTFLGADAGGPHGAASGSDGAPLRALTLLALEPYGSAGGAERVHVHGPEVVIPRIAVLPLGTALCELSTNAVKHGALSGPHGHVEVTWSVRDDPSGRPGEVLLDIGWVERDGPPVGPPERRGYGTSLLERGVTGALGGEAHLDFAPEGLSCWMSLPFGVLERDMEGASDRHDVLVPERARRLPAPPVTNDPRSSSNAST
jgi:two-component sensor histidine kinase